MGNLRKDKQKAHPVTVATAEKIRTALSLRKAGGSYSAIGETLKCTKKYAFDLVLRGLAEIQDAIKEDAPAVKQLEVERLDEMWLALWQRRKEPRVTDSLLRIQERRARLLGLDKPIKFSPTNPDGTKPMHWIVERIGPPVNPEEVAK